MPGADPVKPAARQLRQFHHLPFTCRRCNLMVVDTYSFPIVILGGGFAGAYCARALRSGLQESAHQNVALLADQNAMLFHPMLAEVSGSSISPLHVVNPLRLFCRGCSIFMGTVDGIDLEQKAVNFLPGPFAPPAKLTFEHLVLTIGSVVDVSRVPGMPEHGYLLKTVGDAIRLRSDVLERLEAASIMTQEAIRRKLLTFVVVGGATPVLRLPAKSVTCFAMCSGSIPA